MQYSTALTREDSLKLLDFRHSSQVNALPNTRELVVVGSGGGKSSIQVRVVTSQLTKQNKKERCSKLHT